MQTIVKWIDALNKVVGVLVAAMLGVMAVLIILQVFTRMANYPLHWTEELARYLMVYIVFWGSALALREHRLVAIEVLSERVNPFFRKVLKIIVTLIVMGFAVVLFTQGNAILDIVSRQTAAGLRIPMSIPYAGIPIGATLLFINGIAVIFETLKSPAEDRKDETEGLEGER